MNHSFELEPYRIYFPIGALVALLGTLPWIAFGLGSQILYPGVYHSDIMIGGFLFAYSCGFLMTAVPQFTGSHSARLWELGLSVLLFILLILTGFSSNRVFFHALSGASLFLVITFALNRVVSRSYDPPKFFVFVGLGLLMGLGGVLLLAFSDLQLLAGGWVPFAKLIYTQGMILALILGVGTHLLPAIWGWADLPIQITWFDREKKQSPARILAPVIALALTLLVGFAIEAWFEPTLGRAIRAVLVSYLAIRHWRILKKPRTRGKLAFWLWISAWTLIIGLWAPVLDPSHAIDLLHIAFIGGFGLMTFMIASRVSLAHGGYGVRVEVRSRGLTWTGILILLAAVTRASAGFIPKVYMHHLAYAAIAWFLGISCWSAVFLPRIFRKLGPGAHERPKSS